MSTVWKSGGEAAPVFRRGDIIVREDWTYPEGALVVERTDPDGCLLAHPLGGGPQIRIPSDELARFAVATELEKTPLFHRATFAIEGADETFRGWSDGTLWNGWERPKFEYAESVRVVATVGRGGRYYADDDSFVTCLADGEEEIWPAETITLPDGGTIKVYPVGAGSWIWEELEEAQ
jgi:hypothetical protein